MIKQIRVFIFLLFISISCTKNTDSNVLVYSNTFEDGKLEGFKNAKIVDFYNTKVLGNFNNESFELTLNNLPNHELVDITFDLYIHDTWEGNQQLQNNVSGPDIWELVVDGKAYITTTFSNLDCQPGNFCPPQSYPLDYPNNSSNPKTGASRTDLPGFCSQVNNVAGTTLYKIHKTISHKKEILIIKCLDKLIQKDSANPKCNESWSIDNLNINVINIK